MRGPEGFKTLEPISVKTQKPVRLSVVVIASVVAMSGIATYMVALRLPQQEHATGDSQSHHGHQEDR